MLIKKSLSISGHRTSLALEPEFWAVLEQTALTEGKPVARLVAQIDKSREESNEKSGLASAVRVWLFHRKASQVPRQGTNHSAPQKQWCYKCGTLSEFCDTTSERE